MRQCSAEALQARGAGEMLGFDCKNPCKSPNPSAGEPTVEPMFESKKTLMTRLADAADLMIDFATLGEYGMEPVQDEGPDVCRGSRRRSADRSDAGFASVDRRDHLAARS